MSAESVEIPGYIAGTWDIDPVHSHVGFVARHLMVSKVRGNFTKVEGQIITADNPLESSATATIDMASLQYRERAAGRRCQGRELPRRRQPPHHDLPDNGASGRMAERSSLTAS